MDVAFRAAHLSFAKKRKVGAIAVHNCNIIAYGFNGTPAGCPNECEGADSNTLPNVIHAEDNLSRKILLQGVNPRYFDIYVTKEPCFDCALILDKFRGLNRLFYKETSGSKPGVGLAVLTKMGVYCEQL